MTLSVHLLLVFSFIWLFCMVAGGEMWASAVVLKGIVQRRLKLVESGVNQWVGLQYWGDGHYCSVSRWRPHKVVINNIHSDCYYYIHDN
jgi:hypothetical protein